jgi:repressor of nif and glnA expression
MEDGRKKYDPEEEMKRLKEIEEKGHGQINLEGRNIPKNILESITKIEKVIGNDKLKCFIKTNFKK